MEVTQHVQYIYKPVLIGFHALLLLLNTYKQSCILPSRYAVYYQPLCGSHGLKLQLGPLLVSSPRLYIFKAPLWTPISVGSQHLPFLRFRKQLRSKLLSHSLNE